MRPNVKQAVNRHRPWDIVRFVKHLPHFVTLFFRLLGDSRVPWFPKAILISAAIYAISPLDFIPDMIPVIGELDDLALFAAACRIFIQGCPKHVVDEHVARIDPRQTWNPFQ